MAKLRDPATTPSDDLTHGLSRTYFEGEFHSVNELGEATSIGRTAAAAPMLTGEERPEQFGLTFEGYIRVPEDGIYDFTLASDDGSRLMIGSDVVVDHDGPHGMSERSGQIALHNGLHRFYLSFFQAGGGVGLSLRIQAPGSSDSHAIPSDWLLRGDDERP